MREIYKNIMWFLCGVGALFFWFWGGVFRRQRIVDLGDKVKAYQEENFF